MEITGKVEVITVAADGIGRASTQQLATRTVREVSIDAQHENGDAVAKEIQKKTGREVATAITANNKDCG